MKIGFMDETHQVNEYRYPLTAFGSHDSAGNFAPLGLMLSSCSDQSVFEILLANMKGSLGKHFKPHTIMVDKSDGERNAIKSVFPEVRVRLCYWHLTGNIKLTQSFLMIFFLSFFHFFFPSFFLN